jgi:DNA-directed RNA polymerase III subunit RPC6
MGKPTIKITSSSSSSGAAASSSSSSKVGKGVKINTPKIQYDDDNDSISNEIEASRNGNNKRGRSSHNDNIDDSDDSDESDDYTNETNAGSLIKKLNNKINKGDNAGDIFFELIKNIKDNSVSSDQLSALMAGVSEERYRDELVPFINQKVASNLIQLFKDVKAGENVVSYVLMKTEDAQKFEGLSSEQRLVYDVCDRASNKGIWTRDIKLATNIPQHNLTKILKLLEQRKLIKSVRSVASKSKKLYMLYNATPTKEITGGPWYTEQEFDQQFIDELSKFIIKAVGSKSKANINEISEIVKSSGVSTVELTLEELESVLNTLVYDGELDEIKKYPKTYQRIMKNNEIQDPVKGNVPCLHCPVISQCIEGGIIAPSTCLYLDKWLKTDDDIF